MKPKRKAPTSWSSLVVGTAPRMRVSSVISSGCPLGHIGTFRSAPQRRDGLLAAAAAGGETAHAALRAEYLAR